MMYTRAKRWYGPFLFSKLVIPKQQIVQNSILFPYREWYNKKQTYNKVSSTKRSTKRGFINVKLHISVSCTLLDVTKKFNFIRLARKSVEFMKGFVKIASFLFVTLSYGCCFHLQKYIFRWPWIIIRSIFKLVLPWYRILSPMGQDVIS